MWNSKPTLTSRLTKTITLLTFGITLLFTLVTVFIGYSLEDAMFQQQLRQGQTFLKKGYQLPHNITLKANLEEFDLSSAQKRMFVEFDNTDELGEFRSKGRHYHYKTVPQGVLLIDTTDIAVVSRSLSDILLIIFFVMLPAFGVSVWVAKKASSHALKPFNQLKALFLTEQQGVDKLRKVPNDIQEQDVKLIAEELVQALEEKSELLEQQITFNQGMSHELRTPLQVMTHSLELLSNKFEGINEAASYKRVHKSIGRMQRISNGLLWLTSDENPHLNTNINDTLDQVLADSDDLTKAHNINVEVDSKASLNLPLPSIVFELIVMNLLNNVILHSREIDGKRHWQITISDKSVNFANQANETGYKSIDRFGLGLMLVTKLSNKFGLTLETQLSGEQFFVQISNSNKV